MIVNSNKTRKAGLLLGAIAFIIGGALGNGAWAQEASELDASEAQEFMGTWLVSMDFGDMKLTVSDVGGKVAATLESDQMPEPQLITEITKSDEGLEFAFDSDFGRIIITAKIEDGALVGTLGDEAGQFSAEITGTKEEASGGGEASDLDVSEAEGYIGKWTISMEFGDMTLTVSDVGGKLGATLESDQMPEPQVITDITKTEEGIDFAFDSDFGRLTISTSLEGGELVGTLGDDAGQFSVEITGTKEGGGTVVTDADQIEAAETGETAPQQRRRRRGRNAARMTHGEKNISVAYGDLAVDGPDYPAIENTKVGDILVMTRSAVSKLRTEVNMKFGDALLKINNVAENYPGVYSVWLKKTSGGWNFVFNERSDVWGTQHAAEADVAEVAAKYSDSADATENFEVKLEGSGDGGVLSFAWGPHLWTADFDIVVAAN